MPVLASAPPASAVRRPMTRPDEVATARLLSPARTSRTGIGGAPCTDAADPHDDQPSPGAASEATDPSLARLARGVQDCARAVACLADRLDGLERRVEVLARPLVAPTSNPGPGPEARAASRGLGLEPRLRDLEGEAEGRLQGLDQRLRRLETLPASVARLQKDTAWLTDLATTRRLEAAAASAAKAPGPDHGASPSLERVRTLERAVLEMRRHLEWSLTEHTRVTASDQLAIASRLERLEARLETAAPAAPPRD